MAPTISVFDGPSRAIVATLRALTDEVSVESALLTGRYDRLTLNPSLSEFGPGSVEVLRVHQPLGGRLGYTVAYPPRFHSSFARLARSADLVHFHGVWLYPTAVGGRIVRNLGRPYVISPYGSLMVDALRRSHLKKALALALFERENIEAAAAIVATSQQELDQLRTSGFSSPGTVIPLALDTAATTLHSRGRSLDSVLARSERTVLCVSRFHPQKRLVELVEAFAAVADTTPNWRLRVVGPDHQPGYREEVIAAARASGVGARVAVEPALEGEKLWTAYRDADLFVLASTFEGFGLVIGEALAAGLPTIATRDAPWPQLLEQRCGWWIDSSVESLRSALAEAMSTTPTVLWEMGQRGTQVIATEFSLGALGRRLRDLYDSVLDGGRPAYPSAARRSG